jgi:hypothetical protein
MIFSIEFEKENSAFQPLQGGIMSERFAVYPGEKKKYKILRPKKLLIVGLIFNLVFELLNDP